LIDVFHETIKRINVVHMCTRSIQVS